MNMAVSFQITFVALVHNVNASIRENRQCKWLFLVFLTGKWWKRRAWCGFVKWIYKLNKNGQNRCLMKMTNDEYTSTPRTFSFINMSALQKWSGPLSRKLIEKKSLFRYLRTSDHTHAHTLHDMMISITFCCDQTEKWAIKMPHTNYKCS